MWKPNLKTDETAQMYLPHAQASTIKQNVQTQKRDTRTKQTTKTAKNKRTKALQDERKRQNKL